MTLQIRNLERGGWSSYGGGSIDMRAYPGGAVILQGFGPDEELATTVTFGENISTATATSNGVTASTPTLSTTTASFELSTMDGGGYAEILFVLASGQKRLLRIYASGAFDRMRDDYCAVG